ncbi:MAG: universal stress protein, partial [Verrucomicrobiota bacterium]
MEVIEKIPNQFHGATLFHPSDFSVGDECAIAHAIKIAMAANSADLHFLHTEKDQDIHWSDFPHVRETLKRWDLPADREENNLEALKETHDHLLNVRKVRLQSKHAAKSIANYVEESAPELVILSTHQRKGVSRWLNKGIAEPVARKGKTKTLFVPRRIRGFVSTENGRVRLNQILIP